MMVYMIYNTRAVRADHQGVEPDQDAQGPGRHEARRAGGRRAVKMLPLLAKKNGIDSPRSVSLSVAPNLQEQMLLQGQVDSSRSSRPRAT